MMITLFFSCAATFRHSRAVWISSVVSKCFKTVKFSDEPFGTDITFDINKTVTILLKINKNNFKIRFFMGHKSRLLGISILDIFMEFIIQQRQFCCLREHQFSILVQVISLLHHAWLGWIYFSLLDNPSFKVNLGWVIKWPLVLVVYFWSNESSSWREAFLPQVRTFKTSQVYSSFVFTLSLWNFRKSAKKTWNSKNELLRHKMSDS